MIKDNFKENDIFVSALINPDANINDLVHGGLNDSNTQLLTPEHYKTSEFVKQAFTDKDGNFDEALFNTAYNHAAYLYQNLTDLNTSENIQQFVEYNPNDIYAPISRKNFHYQFYNNKSNHLNKYTVLPVNLPQQKN